MEPALRATFLGHQGWIVESEDTAIAVDPVVCDGFGHSLGTDFIVYPPRKVDCAKLPRVQAILLSHEHLDHFHLPSLNYFPRSATVYFGPLMPQCVEDALNRLGFSTCRFAAPGQVAIGDLIIDVFPAGAGTVTWERNVTSFCVRRTSADEPALFIAVDAIISEAYVELVTSGHLTSPSLVVVSNNSQVVPEGGHGAQSNLLPIDVDRSARITGLEILSDILGSYLADLPDIPNVAICGNGFVNNKKPYGPFEFSDNDQLAEIANVLSLGCRVFGPLPGDTLAIDAGRSVTQTHCDYIEVDTERHRQLIDRRTRFVAGTVETGTAPLWIEKQASLTEMVEVIATFLQSSVPALLISPTGQAMLEQHSYLDGPTGSRRAVIRLLTESGALHFVYNVRLGQFERIEISAADAIRRIPFGIEFHISDLYAVLQGKIQIWDLIGSNVRSWYVGSKYSNLTSFLFTALGEQARPDLASKVYNDAIDRILT